MLLANDVDTKMMHSEPVWVTGDGVALKGSLALPPGARGVVLFAHASGSGRGSPRNFRVAEHLVRRNFAVLLLDLLVAAEDDAPHALRFDIDLLARRLIAARRWLAANPRTAALDAGYFGGSTGAAAALVASTWEADRVRAIVSRGGRTDLATSNLPRVLVPTLLIVGSEDAATLPANRDALALLRCDKKLCVVPGATPAFEAPGALEQVAALAGEWFAGHFPPRGESRQPPAQVQRTH